MEIKTLKQLQRAKLRRKYELELSKLETKVAVSKLEKYQKFNGILEMILANTSSKSTSIITAVAGVAYKIFGNRSSK